MNKTVKFIISILICQFAGLIGSFFTTPSIDTWYASIIKPSFNPPNYVFGPVWITLFLIMGISLYLVWSREIKKKKDEHLRNSAIEIFSIHLILNILWSIIFFGLHAPKAAFIEIVVLWAFIIFTIINFRKVSKTAAYLLIPYLIWVSFAMILNLAIAILN